MRPRNLMLGSIVSAVLLGIAGGVWVNTTPKAPPQPEWRRAAHSGAASSASFQFVDNAPEDTSPAPDLERLPTWKRRALQQANADGPSQAAYLPDPAFGQATDAPEPVIGTEGPVSPDDGNDADAEQDTGAEQDAGAVQYAGRAAVSSVSRQSVAAQQLQPARDDAGAQPSFAGQDDDPGQ